MRIFINGIEVTTTQPPKGIYTWPYGYFDPTVDTLAIQGADIGGNVHCHLYFDDEELLFQYNYDHLKCGPYSDGWTLANFNDSSWGRPFVTVHQQGFWASTGSFIYCRYQYIPSLAPSLKPTYVPGNIIIIMLLLRQLILILLQLQIYNYIRYNTY